jgi:hypothetical protein
VTALLVIDIGNTNVSLGLFDESDAAERPALAQHWRIATRREQTSDEVALLVSSLFRHVGGSEDEVGDVITRVSSRRCCRSGAGLRSSSSRRSSSGPASRPACRCATRTRARSARIAS